MSEKHGVRTTSDYEQFGEIEGNRKVNRSHVRELMHLINANGNLIDKFPIKVNSNMEILDGQHRFEALKELGLPVVYEIVDGANINTVRAINLGNRNWNWQDMAQSYYDLGNEEYGWFLRYTDGHNLPFRTAMMFCGQPYGGRTASSNPFNQGYLKIEEKTKAVALAEHYNDMLAFTNDVAKADFAKAVKLLWTSEDYEEERMLKKMADLGHTLPTRASAADYARKLEEFYNHHMSDTNRVRLF